MPYVQPAALVIGGLWAYMRFIRERKQYPKVMLTARLDQVAWHDGRRIVRVCVDVRNDGAVRLTIPKMRYTLRTLRQGDPVVDGDAEILGQPVFPNLEVHRRLFFPPTQEYAFVDAGTTATFTSVAHLPANARVALVQITLKYRDPDSDFHGAVALLELPDPPAKKTVKSPRSAELTGS